MLPVVVVESVIPVVVTVEICVLELVVVTVEICVLEVAVVVEAKHFVIYIIFHICDFGFFRSVTYRLRK